MVCDSRYELTSKHPGRGRGRDAEREGGREREPRGRESAGNKRGQRGEAPNDSGQNKERG